jgi:hypothetical protein
MHASRFAAGTVDLYAITSEMAQDTLGHLGSSAVVGTQKQHPSWMFY